MKIIQSIEGMQKTTKELKRKGKSIGFVPTMGALHAGHVSLIRQARKENDVVVVSIFVNPIQFGPAEDYLRYPRDFKTDVAVCKKEGVDIVFNPQVSQMYPEGYKTYVNVEKLSDVLCGRFRTGHFRGVATVVTKLFNLIEPDVAYFGQKDAQQAIIIQRMTKDLNMPVKIKVMPIIREPDGLALSSRNLYLNAWERKEAPVLYQALKKAEEMIHQGVEEPSKIKLAMRRIIRKKKSARIQYIEIVDLDELAPVKKIQDKVLIALAVYIGKARLIDNVIVKK